MRRDEGPQDLRYVDIVSPALASGTAWREWLALHVDPKPEAEEAQR